jgi:hypothetical protein
MSQEKKRKSVINDTSASDTIKKRIQDMALRGMAKFLKLKIQYEYVRN